MCVIKNVPKTKDYWEAKIEVLYCIKEKVQKS